jgi:hypothetical protein
MVTLIRFKTMNCTSKQPIPSQCVIMRGDGLVTDFRRVKTLKYKEKLSLFINTSPCHPHTRAMRIRTYEGVV